MAGMHSSPISCAPRDLLLGGQTCDSVIISRPRRYAGEIVLHPGLLPTTLSHGEYIIPLSDGNHDVRGHKQPSCPGTISP